MAGDWLKFEMSTFEKPEVIGMADRLGMHETQVVGCLLLVWAWFDQQTADGNAPSVSPAFVDRKTGVTGFADAMQRAGWLEVTDDGLSMPAFDTHNGKSAKKRALTARRVAEHKRKKANAKVTPSALPREEKRRDNPPNPPKGGTGARSKRGGTASAEAPRRTEQIDLAAITRCTHPDQLSRTFRELGLGVCPAGMNVEQAKAWAAEKISRQWSKSVDHCTTGEALAGR